VLVARVLVARVLVAGALVAGALQTDEIYEQTSDLRNGKLGNAKRAKGS